MIYKKLRQMYLALLLLCILISIGWIISPFILSAMTIDIFDYLAIITIPSGILSIIAILFQINSLYKTK